MLDVGPSWYSWRTQGEGVFEVRDFKPGTIGAAPAAGELDAIRSIGNGNIYNPHPRVVTSGEFWRCAHSRTGVGDGGKWIGCVRCRFDNPTAWIRYIVFDRTKRRS